MHPTLEEFRKNPQLRFALEAAARRERARQIGRLVSILLASLHPRKETLHAPRARETAIA